MNNIDDLVEIYECPLCGGAGAHRKHNAVVLAVDAGCGIALHHRQ